MWYSLVIFSALGLPGLIQLDDQRGPYPEIGQCYHRGSVMIKDIVSSGKFPQLFTPKLSVWILKISKSLQEKKKIKPNLNPKVGPQSKSEGFDLLELGGKGQSHMSSKRSSLLALALRW